MMFINDSLSDGILRCWTTPIYHRIYQNCHEFNYNLREFILKKELETNGIQTTNIGAWNSGVNIELWDSKEMSLISNWIYEAATALTGVVSVGLDSSKDSPEFIAECWALIYRSGNYQKLHFHHDSIWSGVYYVSTPNNQIESGAIEFLDPRWAARSSGFYSHKIIPEPGLLIAFPSWLQHWVHPVAENVDSERICIAFNVGVSHAI